MNSHEILQSIGQFSAFDTKLFEKHSVKKQIAKGEIILNEREICRCFYFILSGSFFQLKASDKEDIIIDLHLPGEWMFNQQSLTGQAPSETSIMCFSNAEVIELGLTGFHCLSSQSQAFLQFGKILNQPKYRTAIYDNAMSPAEKYDFIAETKPLLLQEFPLKMIASYLKVTPETLSRVRAKY
jgi:CRP-like cAMP-binding protein